MKNLAVRGCPEEGISVQQMKEGEENKLFIMFKVYGVTGSHDETPNSGCVCGRGSVYRDCSRKTKKGLSILSD